jgi:hypothetical protein
MSKKRLTYFNNVVLPELQKLQGAVLTHGQLLFNNTLVCYIKRNNKIEQSYLAFIQFSLFETPCAEIGTWYRWAQDYGKTWAIKLEDFNLF